MNVPFPFTVEIFAMRNPRNITSLPSGKDRNAYETVKRYMDATVLFMYANEFLLRYSALRIASASLIFVSVTSPINSIPFSLSGASSGFSGKTCLSFCRTDGTSFIAFKFSFSVGTQILNLSLIAV